VPEHRAYGFAVMVLLEDLHRDAVAMIVGLQHRVADDPAVGLAEPPDVLAGDRAPDLALAARPPGRPEFPVRTWHPPLARLFQFG